MSHGCEGDPPRLMEELVASFTKLNLRTIPDPVKQYQFPTTAPALPCLPLEVRELIFMEVVRACLIPKRIFLDVRGRLLSTKAYAEDKDAKSFRRPNPWFLLALNRRSIELAKSFLYSRNTWVLPSGRLTTYHYFRLFDPLCLLRIHSVRLSLTWRDAAWMPVDANVVYAPQRSGDAVGQRWAACGQEHRRNGAHDRHFWTSELLNRWTIKLDTLKLLMYADHAVVDASEAHNPDGVFIGMCALKLKWFLRVPPHFEVLCGKEGDREQMDKAIEVDSKVSGKSIRPCRFCGKSARNEFARFLKCFQPLPVPPALPTDIADRLDVSRLAERLKGRRGARGREERRLAVPWPPLDREYKWK